MFSSQESHAPHGVGPPAQLVSVPVRLAKLRETSFRFVSKWSVVVPPEAAES
jgi:hypothetical protein